MGQGIATAATDSNITVTALDRLDMETDRLGAVVDLLEQRLIPVMRDEEPELASQPDEYARSGLEARAHRVAHMSSRLNRICLRLDI